MFDKLSSAVSLSLHAVKLRSLVFNKISQSKLLTNQCFIESVALPAVSVYVHAHRQLTGAMIVYSSARNLNMN